jgi:YD repeat-containing protein
MKRRILFVLILVMTVVVARSVSAQQGARYIYDEKGQLIAVVLFNGEAAIYDYDPAGNPKAIRRLTADMLELLTFSPRVGVPGDEVTIHGVGMGGGVNSVAFNGIAATIVRTTPISVVAIVPEGAATGPISVTTPQRTAQTAIPFTVRGIRLIPQNPIVLQSESVQFTATVYPATETVVWSVNGVIGGDALVGTISGTGLYTAPGSFRDYVAIRAAAATDVTIFRETRARIINPERMATPFSASISIRLLPSPTITGLATPFSAGVSVKSATVTTTGQSTPFSAGVAVAAGPYVTMVSPGQLAVGVSGALSITGIRLNGATSIAFVKSDGTVDTQITASNLSVNPEGANLTATVTVSGGTTTGTRTVIVTTPLGNSQSSGSSNNQIAIQ